MSCLPKICKEDDDQAELGGSKEDLPDFCETPSSCLKSNVAYFAYSAYFVYFAYFANGSKEELPHL